MLSTLLISSHFYFPGELVGILTSPGLVDNPWPQVVPPLLPLGKIRVMNFTTQRVKYLCSFICFDFCSSFAHRTKTQKNFTFSSTPPETRAPAQRSQGSSKKTSFLVFGCCRTGVVPAFPGDTNRTVAGQRTIPG